MNVRTFVYNQDAFFVRIGEEKPIVQTGRVVGKATEQARISCVEFESATRDLAERVDAIEAKGGMANATERTGSFTFEAYVEKLEESPLNCERKCVDQYLGIVTIEMTRRSKWYQIRDVRFAISR